MFSDWLKTKDYLNFSKIIIFSIIYLYLAIVRIYVLYRAFNFLILMSAHRENIFRKQVARRNRRTSHDTTSPEPKCHSEKMLAEKKFMANIVLELKITWVKMSPVAQISQYLI
jgi:hypothetical protein